jgi:hypothetical protein
VTDALKKAHKTYKLFAVAKLFLSRPERFAMVVKKTDSQVDKNLYLTTDDSFVFATEMEAVEHVLDHHIARYFDVGVVEVPPPAGNFTCLHRCGTTGKVLCPPNYHKYQEMLLLHHEKFFPRMPFAKFKAKLEKITDLAEIENWKVESSKVNTFLPRNFSGNIGGGEDETAESGSGLEMRSREEAKKYFLEHFKDKAILACSAARIAGETFAKMPRSVLGRSVVSAIERERVFPIRFVNNIHGRLRRTGFSTYKIGGKSGINYISSIKRKFRTVGDVLADGIQEIICCIDAHQGISVADLCAQCCPSLEPSPADPAAEIQASASQMEIAGNPETAEASPEAQVNAFQESESAKAATENNVIDAQRKSSFLKNLYWLIMEGYVAEFENGTLMSTAIMQPRKSEQSSESADVKLVADVKSDSSDCIYAAAGNVVVEVETEDFEGSRGG